MKKKLVLFMILTVSVGIMGFSLTSDPTENQETAVQVENVSEVVTSDYDLLSVPPEAYCSHSLQYKDCPAASPTKTLCSCCMKDISICDLECVEEPNFCIYFFADYATH